MVGLIYNNYVIRYLNLKTKCWTTKLYTSKTDYSIEKIELLSQKTRNAIKKNPKWRKRETRKTN